MIYNLIKKFKIVLRKLPYIIMLLGFFTIVSSQTPCPAQNLSLNIEDGTEFIEIDWDIPVDNCDIGIYSLYVGGGSWDSEISWELEFQDSIIATDIVGTFNLELEYGDYIMHMHDSYGDGWNGADFILTDESDLVVASGTLDSGNYGTLNFTLFDSDDLDRDLLGYNIHKKVGFVETIIFCNNTTYLDFEILFNTQYCYSIIAVFHNGESEPTEELCGFVTDPDEYAIMSFENGTISSGYQNNFNISLDNSYGIVGFQLELEDSPNYLETINVLTTERTETFELFYNEFEGSIFIAGYQPELLELDPGSGSILEISFSAEEVEEDVVINLDFHNVILSNSNAQEVISLGLEGQITILSELMIGDLNSDSVLNILDIIILTNIILGIQEPRPYHIAVGDINIDGIINVVDIILLINLIMIY